MNEVIRTSNEKWLEKALELYKNKTPFEFVDDFGIGITEEDLISAVALIKAAKEKGGITWKEIAGILTGLGMSGVGIWMIVIAVADPEPTSKLGILLAGGVLLVLTGGLSILRCLGVKWRVKAGGKGGSITVEPSQQNAAPERCFDGLHHNIAGLHRRIAALHRGVVSLH